MKRRHTRGFTLIELLVVISIIALLLGILLPALGKAQQNANKIKDGTQVRGIMQAMVQWASDTGGSFPNPDLFGGARPGGVPQGGTEARTGALLGMMITARSIVPELCVSPSEAGQIVPLEAYRYDDPEGSGLYDPAFKGSPIDGMNNMTNTGFYSSTILDAEIGHNSYAHMAIAGPRANFWQSSLSSATPIWANRGPVYDESNPPMPGGSGRWDLVPNETGISSTSLAVHGPGNRWEGNIAFADGHVEYATEPNPSSVTFLNNSTGNPFTQNDNIFVDELTEGATANPATRRNAIMRIFAAGIPRTQAVAADTFLPDGDPVWVDGI